MYRSPARCAEDLWNWIGPGNIVGLEIKPFVSVHSNVQLEPCTELSDSCFLTQLELRFVFTIISKFSFTMISTKCCWLLLLYLNYFVRLIWFFFILDVLIVCLLKSLRRPLVCSILWPGGQVKAVMWLACLDERSTPIRFPFV